MMKTVASLNRDTLRRLAGGRSFERGEQYFLNGHVNGLVEYSGTVTAKVQGTREYRVKLWDDDDELGFSCTCPVGVDGLFCKHCVAVGLSLLKQNKKTARKKSGQKSVTMKDVRNYLAGEDKDTLVEMLMDQAMEDDRLRNRLMMKTAKKSPRGLNIATYKKAVDSAVNAGGFVDYYSVSGYVYDIEEVIGSIEELLKEGYDVEVIDLAEYVLKRVEEAIENVDDSDGQMSEILERLQYLHLEACRKAKPDPEELAERLFKWELRTEWDTFYDASVTYADILGEKGLIVYRKLAESEWKKVPSIGPDDDNTGRYGKYFRITRIMETFAERSGDIEALVAVMSRDLSSAYSFLQIAEIYKKTRRYDKALDWAERGLKAFPGRTDSRLREFLASEYHRLKRHDDAMTLIWAEFTDWPHLDRYQNLKKHADRIKQWNEWREKALAFIREGIAGTKRKTKRDQWSGYVGTDHSELVRIFLWERNVEAAWHEAKKGGCSNDLWLELARKLEKKQPEESVRIYKNQIEPTIERKNNQAYNEAVALLQKIGKLMSDLGRAPQFRQYLASLRTMHKRKRNLIKLLDGYKW